MCTKCCSQNTRERVTHANEPVAPDVAAVAADVVEGPVLFLEIAVTPAAVKV